MLFLGLSISGAENDGLVLRVHKALELRKELLANYSVETQSRTVMKRLLEGSSLTTANVTTSVTQASPDKTR